MIMMFPNTVFLTETMFANIILLWKIMTYCRLWSGWIGLSGAFRAISIVRSIRSQGAQDAVDFGRIRSADAEDGAALS